MSVSVSPASATLSARRASSPRPCDRQQQHRRDLVAQPAVGTISASGLYTAPGVIASAQTVTVTATSVADATKSASATVNCSR